MLLLCGCGSFDISNTKVVLTTGFDKDEVFRIEEISCSIPEVMVYLTNIQKRYEKVYGDEIWRINRDGVMLEDEVKDSVLAKIAQIKTMNLMAEQMGVTLEEAQEKLVVCAAKEYYASLDENEIESLGVTAELIEQLYREYAIANQVYQYIIRDVNPEISDDEARIITIEHILIKTYALDANGQKIEYLEQDRKEARELAEQIHELAVTGEVGFEELAAQYSEAENITYSFGKGVMEPAFETAAFNLGGGEISDIVTTSYGYHIMKCISTFNKEETDANKVKIVERKRQEVFSEQYDAFVATLTRDLNEPLWDSVSFLYDEGIDTSNFFEIYDDFFGDGSGV